MTVYDVAIIPFLVGIIELCKHLGLPKKLSPLVSVLLGIIIGIVYVAPENLPEAILVGASLGLGACGLYSGTKNTKEQFTK